MAHQRIPVENTENDEIWLSMSSGASREREQIRGVDPTAYQATPTRHRTRRSAPPNQYASIPSITTTVSLNKPLPPSPDSNKSKTRKPVSVRPSIHRHTSEQIVTIHLQPGSSDRQRPSSAQDHLSPNTYQYQHHHTRSMPTSPSYSTGTYSPPALARAISSASNYSDSAQYPYQSQLQDPNFVSQPPRTRRTFPEDSPTFASRLQRPRTRQTTEPFYDASEVHLFVEATSGLADGSFGFSSLSPISPVPLQGSLFNHGRQNDRISISLQPAPRPHSQSYYSSGWQSMGSERMPYQPAESPPISSSALPRRASSYQEPYSSSNMHAINLELENLGIGDEDEPEDELPNYAQSQAEMSARRKKQATDRARELEARWNSSRARRDW